MCIDDTREGFLSLVIVNLYTMGHCVNENTHREKKICETIKAYRAHLDKWAKSQMDLAQLEKIREKSNAFRPRQDDSKISICASTEL